MTMAASYFIGWDVGGWSCDKNKDSRDAIVVIDENKEVVGKPWHGSLRGAIAASRAATDVRHAWRDFLEVKVLSWP
jgi:hypothetical protein